MTLLHIHTLHVSTSDFLRATRPFFARVLEAFKRAISEASYKAMSIWPTCKRLVQPTITLLPIPPPLPTGEFSLTHRQARDARRQADTSRRYEGLIVVHLENREVVLGKYSGGWKIHCDDPGSSFPVLLFRFMDRWLPGFIHGEGTFEFTSDSDVFLWGVRKGDV